MAFKKLNVNRDKILGAIQECCPDAKIEGPTEQGAATIFIVTDGNEKPATLNFYFRTDGLTTIHPGVGKNQQLSRKIASFIHDSCLISERKDVVLSMKGIPKNIHELLLEYLPAECEATVVGPEQKEYSVQHKVSGHQNDTITINYYPKNGSGSLLIQGRPLHLYCEIIEFIAEIHGYDEFLAAIIKEFHVPVTPADIDDEMKDFLPTAHTFLSKRVRAILSPALVLRKVDVPVEDYSCFAFPALRGLEGYIWQLFLRGKKMVKRDRLSKQFTADQPPQLVPGVKYELKNDLLCAAIEEAYDYYRRQRHGLFHVDATPETTRIIEDRKAADSIVADVLELVERTHASLP